MDQARSRSAPVNEMWALLGALGLVVLVSAAEVGAGARPFDPPDVTPAGPLAVLVEAADLAWSPPILRSAAVIAGLLVAVAAVVLAAARRPWPRWAAVGLTALVVLLMTVPGVALQAGLRQSTEPWFFTNDSTYQIELGGQVIREGQTPYGHDYRTSGMERVYTLDGSATARARERQVALQHFAYFPGTPLTAVPWGLLPEPWSDYRFFVLLCTLAAGAAALLFRGPLAWRLALGALIAASPVAIRAGWFGQADAPAILFMILAFAAAMRRRWIWCGLAIAAAVLLKQFALFAIPFLGLLALQRGGRAGAGRTAVAFAIPVAAGFIPFLIADAHALWVDTIQYGGSIYPIIGYGLAPLLVKAGLLASDDDWPFALVALLTWLPATLLLLRAQSRSGRAWIAGVGFSASIFILFFASRVFQETYVIWPLAGIALAGLLWLDERDRGPLLEPGAEPDPPVPDDLAPQRVDVLGCMVDRVTLDQAVERLGAALAGGEHTRQFSANAAKVVAMATDERLARIASTAELVTADGSSVVLASRLFGDPLPERVTGIDLMHRLFQLAEEEGHPVYVLGSTPETLELALGNLRRIHPALVLAGARNGYFGPDEEAGVIEEIRASGARAVFVAMGSPRTELWLDEHGAALDAPVTLGVGGSIDVLAGRVRRAPALFQRLHLEWLYRLAQEPRRLFARNLVSVTFWRMAIARRLSGRAASADRRA